MVSEIEQHLRRKTFLKYSSGVFLQFDDFSLNLFIPSCRRVKNFGKSQLDAYQFFFYSYWAPDHLVLQLTAKFDGYFRTATNLEDIGKTVFKNETNDDVEW